MTDQELDIEIAAEDAEHLCADLLHPSVGLQWSVEAGSDWDKKVRKNWDSNGIKYKEVPSALDMFGDNLITLVVTQ